MSDVTVITMSREQVERLLDEKISAALKEQSGKIEENWAVDRKFLKVNFQWDRRKVERLERDRTLKPVFTGDGKSRFYRLSDCIQIYRNEHTLPVLKD